MGAARSRPAHPLSFDSIRRSKRRERGPGTEPLRRIFALKIVAWGGLASLQHVTRYIQPGLELIALDPKRSATIIGPEAFASEDVMAEVAVRAAGDIGTLNQEGCACAR